MTRSGPLSSIHNCWGATSGDLRPAGLVFFDPEGVRLLLERGAPSSVLYLEVEDVRLSISVLQGRGVEVIALPHVIFHHGDAALGPAGTDEWMAFIRDSEGNTVDFFGMATCPNGRPASAPESWPFPSGPELLTRLRQEAQ
ncbi:VOC family protein [Pseudarthrobacter sp. NBSH8]|uniref:VOC family protein n=1 Tax=Pseudarthrobacter sp. NBSH8 TaxID=2596911 RepID=UPI00351ADD9A